MSSGAARGKRLGQNFLVDRTAVERIVELLGPRPGEAVLEIGPGRGALTAPLISAAGRIGAVEVDDRLADGLAERFSEERLTLIRADVLQVDLAEVVIRLGHPAGTRLVLAGNLPYSISKPVAMHLVRGRETVARAVLMFQSEVANRITAAPGSRDYGPMSVLCGAAFRIRNVFDLGPGAFRPRPKVRSTVTSWIPRRDGALTEENESAVRACLSACFSRRRQTLRNNLRAALGSDQRADRLLERAGLDGSLRAEVLPGEAFLELARWWAR